MMTQNERIEAGKRLAMLAAEVYAANRPDRDEAMAKIKEMAAGIGAEINLTVAGPALMMQMPRNDHHAVSAKNCSEVFLFEAEKSATDKALCVPMCDCGCGQAKLYDELEPAKESFNELIGVTRSCGVPKSVTLRVVRFERREVICEEFVPGRHSPTPTPS